MNQTISVTPREWRPIRYSISRTTPTAASRTFVAISELRSRDAVVIMLWSGLYVHRRSNAADHLWQSGRQDIYGCEVLRNLPETAPGHRDHLSTMRVRCKAGEA